MSPYAPEGTLTTEQREVAVSETWDSWNNPQSMNNVEIVDGSIQLAEFDPRIDTFESVLYEDQSRTLSDYYGGNVGQYSRQQSTVQSGSYALECTGSSTRINSVPDGANNDLPNYPSAGDTFEFYTYLTTNSDSRFAFGVGSVDDEYTDNYEIGFRPLNDRFELSRGNNQLISDETTPPQDEWMRAEVDWGSNGDISISIENSSGTEIASLSASDTIYTTGGIGFGTRDGTCYFDEVSLL